MTSLIVVFIIGAPFIKFFRKNDYWSNKARWSNRSHNKKSGTPTMGGLIIIIGIIFSTLLWGRFIKYIRLDIIFVSLSLGGLGLLDDILKIKFKNSTGLKSKYKFQGNY